MTKEIGKNCTTIFLLTGIGLHRQELLQYGFISAYLKDRGHSITYRDAIYLLYRPDDINAFQEFLAREYKRTPLLVEDYDYKGGFVVTVYKFPREFMREYELFLEGKYSQFGERYIRLFPKTVPVPGKTDEQLSLQHLIFTRHPAIKEYWENKIGMALPEEAEMWSSPNIETTETLDIEEVKKLI